MEKARNNGAGRVNLSEGIGVCFSLLYFFLPTPYPFSRKMCSEMQTTVSHRVWTAIDSGVGGSNGTC